PVGGGGAEQGPAAVLPISGGGSDGSGSASPSGRQQGWPLSLYPAPGSPEGARSMALRLAAPKGRARCTAAPKVLPCRRCPATRGHSQHNSSSSSSSSRRTSTATRTNSSSSSRRTSTATRTNSSNIYSRTSISNFTLSDSELSQDSACPLQRPLPRHLR